MRIQEYSTVNNNCIYVRTDLYILRHSELGASVAVLVS